MTKLYAASHALISDGQRVLLTRRAGGRNYMPNKWDIPGGTIEAGEGPLDALLREISEETQIKVALGRCVYVYNNMTQFPDRQTLQIVYAARYLSGEVILNEREHTEFEWCDIKDIHQKDLINFLSESINYVSEWGIDVFDLSK